MVAGVAIKKREKRAPGYRVNNLVDARERKRILRAVLVEIRVINTHSPFAVLLFYKDWICLPLWMCDFSDKTSG